jgi:hypothetical protein
MKIYMRIAKRIFFCMNYDFLYDDETTLDEINSIKTIFVVASRMVLGGLQSRINHMTKKVLAGPRISRAPKY